MSANVYGEKGACAPRIPTFRPLTISQHTKLLINHVGRHARLLLSLFQLSILVAQIELLGMNSSGFQSILLKEVSG